MFLYRVLLVAFVGYAAGKPMLAAKEGAPTERMIHFQPINRSPKTECGAVFNTEFGEFSSPNYPDIYPKDLIDCGYSIQSPLAGRAVRIRFVDFSTEQGKDVVRVFDNADGSGSPIATLSGNSLTESQAVVTGTGSSLFVNFTTDSSVNDRGFLAQWSVACGNRFAALKGVIESPDYPNSYADDLDACYDIAAAAGKAVRLEFVDIDTEQDVDLISVYDGDSEAAPLLATLSGQSIGNVFYSTGSNLYVSFTSNAGVSGKGFSAYYSQICGNRFGGPSGTVASPNYPGNYPSDADVCYFIEGSAGSRIRLTFDLFDAEEDYDYLTIYDGNSEASPVLAVLTGTANGRVVESTGSTLYLVFTSDYSYNYAGFSASYVEF